MKGKNQMSKCFNYNKIMSEPLSLNSKSFFIILEFVLIQDKHVQTQYENSHLYE